MNDLIVLGTQAWFDRAHAIQMPVETGIESPGLEYGLSIEEINGELKQFLTRILSTRKLERDISGLWI